MKHAIYIFLSLFLTGMTALAQDGSLRLNTVVIDPGHGGKDPGAISKDKHTYEKNLVLDISQRLATCIEEGYPDVKVVMTRDRDNFVELRERPQIANRAGANLFISIHVNSNNNTSPNGYSIHVLGQSSQKDRDLFAGNLDVVKRENSVILLEDDYKTHYQGFDPSDPESFIFLQLMQNAHLEQSLQFAGIVADKLKGGPIRSNRGIAQDPFFVLWKTSMPAVLVELGFISNPTDLAALKNPANRQSIAERLYQAFKAYKEIYDGSIKIGSKEEAPAEGQAPAPAAQEPSGVTAGRVAPAQEAPILYGTQIFATSRLLDPSDKRFLGWTPQVIKLNSLYKYIIGISSDPEQARKNYADIKVDYPGCFMVSISDGATSRFK